MMENNDDITISMPKWKYDRLITETKRLQKSIDANLYRTEIKFKCDALRCTSIEFMSIHNIFKSTENVIPEIISKLDENIAWLLAGINDSLKTRNETNTKFNNELKDFKKKSFWKSLFKE